MRRDRKLTQQQARAMQQAARDTGILLVWTVMRGTADFASSIVCRPFLVSDGLASPVFRYLIAKNIEELRVQLPPGLCCFPRTPADDPVILETWL